jgi:hypothetical protein
MLTLWAAMVGKLGEVKDQRRIMGEEQKVTVNLLRGVVPPNHSDEGLRGLSGKSLIRPESVPKYLEGNFDDVRERLPILFGREES